MIISKTKFMHLLRCEKAFFLHTRHPELKSISAIEPNMQLENGKIIGALGRQMYSGGYDLSQGGTVWGMDLVAATQDAIREGKYQILYEPAFYSPERHIYFQADVLILNRNVYRLVEFKSGSYFKEPYYLYDIGFQARILYDNGYTKKLKIYAGLINKEYVRDGNIKLDELFYHQDVTEKAFAVQPIILDKLKTAYGIIASGAEPIVNVGKHCTKPYPCAFYDYCYRNLSSTSLYHSKTLSEKQIKTLIDKNVQSIAEIPSDFKMSKEQFREIKTILKNAPIINKKAIGIYISNLEYPLSFLDFETINSPFPMYDGISPYKQIPFQYCLLKQIEGNYYNRYDFLAEPNKDPRREFIERLLADVQGQGSILVYNASFEKSILNSLAESFPEYRRKIKIIIDRIVDLMEPFKNKYYWHRSFGDGYSIKLILPIVAPGVSYDHLKIRNGNMAMVAYAGLAEKSGPEKIEIISNLKEYCHFDVLAMEKVLTALYELSD